MPQAPPDLAVFTANAAHVADVLRALANERRLMILCKLVEWGEATVGTPGRGRGTVAVGLVAASRQDARGRDRDLPPREPDAVVPHRRSQNGNAARAPAAALLPT